MRQIPVVVAAVTLLALPLAWPAGAARMEGQVQSGAAPLGGYTVTLYATDPGRPRRCARALGTTVTGDDGAFELAYTASVASAAVLYVIAENDPAQGAPKRGTCPTAGRGGVTLAAVVGVGSAPPAVVVNERTTVASAYAFAQFIDGPNIAGASPGLQNAFQMMENLVDVATGTLGAVLAASPNGDETSTLPTFNSLANVIAACVASRAACGTLFASTAAPGGRPARDTLQALVDLVHAPWQHVPALLALSFEPPAPYQPSLGVGATLDAWTLALRFAGDGTSMDGPGNFAIDAAGTIWVGNNYEFSADPFAPVCSGTLLLRFTPGGRYVEGSPYKGGGLSGVGFGITLDPTGNVWVGNFGFASRGCTDPPASDSVSKFGPNGIPLSVPDGYRDGRVSWPQGTVSDRRGTIWIANCGNSTVTWYPNGDHQAAQWIAGDRTQLDRPFGIATDRKGLAWVTGSRSNNVAVLRPDGTPIRRSPIQSEGLFDRPLGIAADSRGNMWVANSAALLVPCPDGAILPTGGSLVLLRRNAKAGRRAPFTGGGLTIPWGVAVDGDDNVWVANFSDQRVSHFCGTRSSRCPSGVETGQAIAPEGYGFDGLVRNTGIAIDPSGNVWLANNWKTDGPVLPNPGGYQIVAFVGLAKPIRTPLIGPPQRP